MKYFLIITAFLACILANAAELSNGYEYPQPESYVSYLAPQAEHHAHYDEQHQHYEPAAFHQEQRVASYIQPNSEHFEHNSQEYQHTQEYSQPVNSYIPPVEHHDLDQYQHQHEDLHHHEYQASVQQQELEQQLDSFNIAPAEHHEYQRPHTEVPAPVQEFVAQPVRSYVPATQHRAHHSFDSFEPAHHDGYHYKTFRRVVRRHRH